MRTATLEEVRGFLTAVIGAHPDAALRMETFGKSEEGRDLLMVRVPPTGASGSSEDPPLRVLVVANIHAGEVCGKEAVQLILREIAEGEHRALTSHCELVFVPVYNADGNEAMAPDNRRDQNGPVGGMGKRENSKGLDLNRDCVKAESAEFRALLGLMRSFDPHVLFDLHTTDGSPSGYNVTYATSLSTNTDDALIGYTRDELIPAVRTRLFERHTIHTFDYGNFGRGQDPVWETFDHRPRYLTNYVGLRNRISLLSEAYAYDPYETRVRNTRAFVLEFLTRLCEDRQKVRALCDAADRRCVDGDRGVTFRRDTTLAAGEKGEVLVGKWDEVVLENGIARLARRTELEPRTMTVRTRFVSRDIRPLPALGYVLLDPDPKLLDTLAAHGIEVRELGRGVKVKLSRFVPASGDRSAGAYQGHRAITLRGEWQDTETELAEGTKIVPARQKLAHLVTALLEPESEDGLTTWEFFVDKTTFTHDGRTGSFPVARLEVTTGIELR
ncbi:MAG: M14 family metallopeptidase [Planctomycetota bacterium]